MEFKKNRTCPAGFLKEGLRGGGVRVIGVPKMREELPKDNSCPVRWGKEVAGLPFGEFSKGGGDKGSYSSHLGIPSRHKINK